jgi:hypothetical protein
MTRATMTGWNLDRRLSKHIYEFLNVDQLIPITEDLSTQSLVLPDCEHMVNEKEEEGEEMQPLTVHVTHKDAFTALSVLDFVTVQVISMRKL